MKLGSKVKVNYEKSPFTGVIEMIKKWRNPISNTNGIDIVVRAADDNKLYAVPPSMIEVLKSKIK